MPRSSLVIHVMPFPFSGLKNMSLEPSRNLRQWWCLNSRVFAIYPLQLVLLRHQNEIQLSQWDQLCPPKKAIAWAVLATCVVGKCIFCSGWAHGQGHCCPQREAVSKSTDKSWTSFPCPADQMLSGLQRRVPLSDYSFGALQCMLALIFSITQYFFQFLNSPYQPLYSSGAE